MKKETIGITILVALFSLLCFVGLGSYYDRPVLAQTSCPSHMTEDSIECLDYLREQLGKLKGQQGVLQRQLEAEEYQQLTLNEKIAYTNNQIAQTENTIKSLEVQIATHNVEISLLEKSIREKEDNISVLGQEINVLEGAVTKRVTESYKYSFVGPLELFMDIRNLSSILRKTKYLSVTRTQDRIHLAEFSDKAKELKEEEDLLSNERAQLQVKRNSIDEERKELANTKKDLAAQKTERERLLVASKAKEAELQAIYQQNIKKLADLDSAIIAYINKHGDQMVDHGYVRAGEWIGRKGNTGCSSGAHLHFGLNSGKWYDGWGYFYSDVNLFSSGLLRQGTSSFLYWGHPHYWWSPFVHAGSMRLPMGGKHIIMTQTEHQGHAIDLVAYSENAWGYKIDGAPIYAVMEGNLKKGVEGVCGGHYAQITHPNGMVSIYLHLQ